MRQELTTTIAAAAALVAVAGCGSSSKGAAHAAPTSTTVATTTTSTLPTAPARWTDPTLVIDGSSLGAVKVGMTLDQAQQAAGITLDGHGDGLAYPTKVPAGDVHPFVGYYDDVYCVGAAVGDSKTQTVMTPEGFQLGDSLTKLEAIYGARLTHVPRPAQGMSPRDGYVVALPGGRLAFSVDKGTVFEISAGKNGFDGQPLTPSTC